MTKPKVLGGDRLAFAISAVLALVGFFAALRGQMAWWPGIFFAACAATFVLWHLLIDRPHVDSLKISARGVRRRVGPRFQPKKVEAVSWDSLSKVAITTGDLELGSEDVFYLLYGPRDRPMVVPNSLAEQHGLLDELRQRLPDLDNRRIVEAFGCGEDARFLVWQKPALPERCEEAVRQSP